MNAVEFLSLQPWVERLGWTLVHFVWQGLAIALVYAAARRVVNRTWSPNARYLLACAALGSMMAAPLVTWGLQQRAAERPDAAYRIQSTLAGDSENPPYAPLSIPVSEARAVQYFPWIVMIWLSGAIALSARLAGGWVLAARMRSITAREAPPEWQETLMKLGSRIGLSRPVRLVVSALVHVPAAVGCLRPIVLVPVGALAGMPAEQVEALLLHELAHIRRHDYVVNVLQSVAEALLFYHPAVWWVSSHMRAEREHCCDDAVVSVTGDVFTYARALTEVESQRPAHSGAAIAASGGSLSARIARLLRLPCRPEGTGAAPGVLAVIVLLAGAVYGLFGQPAGRPAFSSASIRRNTSDWNQRLRHPMGMGVNSSLMLLIRFAYAPHDNPMRGHWGPLPSSLVAGGPAWIDSEGYDIDAKAAPGTDPRQVWLMWQTLLADKFQLRVHRETRNLEVYQVTAAPGGLHLPAAQPAGCISFAPGVPPRQVPGKVDCGYVSGPVGGYPAGLLHIRGRRVRVADLVRELASILDRPVFDKTGFGGEFDLDLSYAPDNPNFLNIFAALEQQLGLRLEPVQAAVEVLVVDHAERPAAN